MILDLAHASEQTFRDVLEIAGDSPVLCSHASCRAVFDAPRNLADWQLEALAARGGVLGMMALPFVVDESEPTIARLIDHVDHLAQTIGVRHVCLGGDFARQLEASGTHGAEAMSWQTQIAGLGGPEDYPRLLEALGARGYGDDDVRAITSENLVRVLRRTLPA